MTLTRYGLPQTRIIAVAFILLGCLSWAIWPGAFPWVQGIAAALMLAGLAFFRDPARTVPQAKNILLAPADGKITDIIEVDEPDYLQGRATRIGIFLSVFDVHINRTACAGRVEFIREKPGKCLNALRAEDASRENQSTSLGMACPEHPVQKVLIKQITGAIARRIVCGCKIGDLLEAGYKYGMIKFGSRTELYFPVSPGARILVKRGDIVRAGITVLVEYGGEG